MTAPRFEILSQGDEVVNGLIADTNAAWISGRLTDDGHAVWRHTAVGDHLGELTNAFREIGKRADCCICTGGLGPTDDDLTAEAISRAFGLSLTLDVDALTSIEARFERNGMKMPECNRKQALLPAGAIRLDNHWGTAPGFRVQQDRCRFYCLPGVPAEMRAMFQGVVEPDIRSAFPTQSPLRLVFRSFSAGESRLQQNLKQIALPSGTRLGFCLVPPEVHVKLQLAGVWDAPSLRALIDQVRRALGPSIFAVDSPLETQGSLAEAVARQLAERQLSIASVETVSAGRLAESAVAIPDWVEARVYPSAAAALTRLGLTDQNLPTDVQASIAATRLREVSGSDCALVQFHADADGRSAVNLALSTVVGCVQETQALRGSDLATQRLNAAGTSLNFLRLHL